MRIAFVAALALLPAVTLHAEHSVSHHFAATSAAKTIRRVTIDIPAGEIHLVNGPSDQIRIDGNAERHFDSWKREAENQGIVDDLSAAAVVHGDTAVIRRVLGPRARNWRGETFASIDATIALPPGVDVDFETHYGEVHIDGSFGDIDVDMRAGEIHLDTLRNNVRSLDASCWIGEVHTDSGGEKVSSEGFFPHHARIENASGRAIVNLHVHAGEIHVNLK